MGGGSQCLSALFLLVLTISGCVAVFARNHGGWLAAERVSLELQQSHREGGAVGPGSPSTPPPSLGMGGN